MRCKTREYMQFMGRKDKSEKEILFTSRGRKTSSAKIHSNGLRPSSVSVYTFASQRWVTPAKNERRAQESHERSDRKRRLKEIRQRETGKNGLVGKEKSPRQAQSRYLVGAALLI